MRQKLLIFQNKKWYGQVTRPFLRGALIISKHHPKDKGLGTRLGNCTRNMVHYTSTTGPQDTDRHRFFFAFTTNDFIHERIWANVLVDMIAMNDSVIIIQSKRCKHFSYTCLPVSLIMLTTNGWT